MEDAEIMNFIQGPRRGKSTTLRSGGEGVDNERLDSIERMLDQCWTCCASRAPIVSSAGSQRRAGS
jgi:hypothetical protein